MASPDEIKNDNLPDHANVAIFPPLLFGLSLVAGFGLRATFPLPFLLDRLAWIGGPFIVGVALIFAGWAVRTMRAGGASIPTGEPTDVIVQDGPYRYSRNPIYLAMVMSLVGIGVWANSLWFVGLAIVSGALLSWGAISREEAYLQRKFGDRYSAYKASVRRWM